MKRDKAVVVLGTFDSKAEEHGYLRDVIKERGFPALTIHAGTRAPAPFPVDYDLYTDVIAPRGGLGRDEAIEAVLEKGRSLVHDLYRQGDLSAVISAGGGTGTYLCTEIMRILPMGIPKVMISTVASRDMSRTVGTKDITMMHSVVDMLGINSLSAGVLERAAGAVCGMVESNEQYKTSITKKRVALTLFGFITEGAEYVRSQLEALGYEVIPFHANGTGGMAMEELASEGLFAGILDFATHELADALLDGYCGGIGPGRLVPFTGGPNPPRLVVPGGLDCAVLIFDRNHIPAPYRGRRIFFYDFRSAVRLSREEARTLAEQLAEKLNRFGRAARLFVPMPGWSEADREGAPLYDPDMNRFFLDAVREHLSPDVAIQESGHHINSKAFAEQCAREMHAMIQQNNP